VPVQSNAAQDNPVRAQFFAILNSCNRCQTAPIEDAVLVALKPGDTLKRQKSNNIVNIDDYNLTFCNLG